MSATLVAEGALLAHRYLLDDEVGRGGSGIVWSATDLLLGRRVAVKQVLVAPGAGSDELRDRTLAEARATAAVQSPHVVPVYDVVDDGGSLWVVMELLQARTLEAVVAEDGPLLPARVAAIGLDVLGGLQAVHAAGLVHRDVKPSNVLVGDDGRVLLADFGIATPGDSASGDGVLVGSPAYLAPERTRGACGGAAADLWGLGATLATAVEGRAVFQREGPLPTLLAVLHDEPVLEQAGPLAPVLRGLLAKDPALRWDATRARAELLRVRSGAVPPPRADHAGRLALPSAAVLVAIVAAGLLVAGPRSTPGVSGEHEATTAPRTARARVTSPPVAATADRTTGSSAIATGKAGATAAAVATAGRGSLHSPAPSQGASASSASAVTGFPSQAPQGQPGSGSVGAGTAGGKGHAQQAKPGKGQGQGQAQGQGHRQGQGQGPVGNNGRANNGHANHGHADHGQADNGQDTHGQPDNGQASTGGGRGAQGKGKGSG